MPRNPTWKAVERRVAQFFGTTRTPLSGGNSGHTRSDTLHPKLFIEVKYVSTLGSSNGWILRWLRRLEFPRETNIIHDETGNGIWILVHSSELEDFEFKGTFPWSTIPVQGERLYFETSDLAELEDKTPILALAVRGKQGFWLVGSRLGMSEAREGRLNALGQEGREEPEAAT